MPLLTSSHLPSVPADLCTKGVPGFHHGVCSGGPWHAALTHQCSAHGCSAATPHIRALGRRQWGKNSWGPQAGTRLMGVYIDLGGRRQGPDWEPVELLTPCLACSGTHERRGASPTPCLPVVPGKPGREWRDLAGGGRVGSPFRTLTHGHLLQGQKPDVCQPTADLSKQVHFK